jgi:hypothetical protein
MTQQKLVEGDRVKAEVSPGIVLSGHIVQIQDPGPYKAYRTIKVKFDDPLVMGGTGTEWFAPDSIEPES